MIMGEHDTSLGLCGRKIRRHCMYAVASGRRKRRRANCVVRVCVPPALTKAPPVGHDGMQLEDPAAPLKVAAPTDTRPAAPQPDPTQVPAGFATAQPTKPGARCPSCCPSSARRTTDATRGETARGTENLTRTAAGWSTSRAAPPRRRSRAGTRRAARSSTRPGGAGRPRPPGGPRRFSPSTRRRRQIVTRMRWTMNVLHWLNPVSGIP